MLSYEDIREAAIRESLARETRLTAEIFRTPGSEASIAISATAAQAEEVAAFAQGGIASLRLATAASVSEEALDQLGASDYGGETRRGALASIASLRFSRDTSDAAGSLAAGYLVGTPGGVTFTTDDDVIFAAGEVGPVEVTATASTAGAGGNVPAGSITRMIGQRSDLTITVTNPEPSAGGRPAETPAEYQARLQTAWTRAPRGTLAAIQAAAENVEGVQSARAFELLDGTAQTGRVVVQVLGYGGTTNRALRQRVSMALDSVRCAGVPVLVIGLAPRPVSIRVFGLVIEAGYQRDAVLGAARDALVASITSGLDVGATLYRTRIAAVLFGIEGLSVPDGSIVTPAADVVPLENEYITTTRDLISLSTEPA